MLTYNGNNDRQKIISKSQKNNQVNLRKLKLDNELANKEAFATFAYYKQN